MLKLILAFLVATISIFSYDFNGDGYNDIVFQDTLTKKHKIKFMDLDGIYSSREIGLKDKTFVAFGNFNNDEFSDIVVKDIETNVHTIYFMSASGIIGIKFLGKKDFKVAGTGDFNGDGHSNRRGNGCFNLILKTFNR